MKSYRQLKALLVGFLVVYFVVGQGLRYVPAVHTAEIYPFFSWDLFSHVPNRIRRYELLIHAVESPPHSPALPRQGERLVRRLGRAL